MDRWSVIVWAAVTSDLESAIQADLMEAWTALKALDAGEDLHVHVFLNGPRDTSLGIRSWPEPGAGKQADATAADMLKDALQDTTCWADPGRKRLLVLWGHGNRAFPTGEIVSRVQLDALLPDVPSPERVAESIRQSPDIIGYDACRMASLSTVRTFAQVCPKAVFVGSMVPEPASGWPYFQLLRSLRQGWDKYAVATALVEAYAASVDTSDWCMVALDLAKVAAHDGSPGLEAALAKLTGSTPPGAVEFYSAAEGADLLDDTNLVDLGALMRRLDLVGSRPMATAVRAALLETVIARRAGGSLVGRDGVAVQVELPPAVLPDASWTDPPDWVQVLPELAPPERPG